MKSLRALAGLVCTFLLASCSYNGIRMHERQGCGAMPQTEAARCYALTEDTQAESDNKRSKLKRSLEKEREKPLDPRYEQWIP